MTTYQFIIGIQCAEVYNFKMAFRTTEWLFFTLHLVSAHYLKGGGIYPPGYEVVKPHKFHNPYNIITYTNTET